MPEGAIYIGRPTIYGNPYIVGKNSVANKQHAVLLYEIALYGRYEIANGKPMPTAEQLETLRGKDLVCWCGLDEFCHADVLLELVNQN